MDLIVKSPYKNGFWTWDEVLSKLAFISRETSPTLAAPVATTLKATQGLHTIKFKESNDKLEKLTFRRLIQRRCKPDQPDVVTIQDIKDVTLYLANSKDLTPELINYLHLPIMDRLFRALVVYFQYYTQVWDHMMERRIEASRKLRQPVVTVLENVIRDDLADLRAMVAREYGILLSGVGKAVRFHHMGTTDTSLSDKDRRLNEQLLCVAVRVVWVALQRKQLSLIELELNRMLRAPAFNVITHQKGGTKASLARSAEEDRVLEGKNNLEEPTLLQRSATIKELKGVKDFRMMGIGFRKFPQTDERIRYLELAYAAPEELLLDNGVGIGILGVPRSEYDPTLQGRERTSKNFDIPPIEIPFFKMPPRIKLSDDQLPATYSNEPCQYQETNQTKQARIHQCKLWKKLISTVDSDVVIQVSAPNKASMLNFGMSMISIPKIEPDSVPVNSSNGKLIDAQFIE